MTKWKEWLLLILLAICLRLAVNLVLPDLPNEGKFYNNSTGWDWGHPNGRHTWQKNSRLFDLSCQAT